MRPGNDHYYNTSASHHNNYPKVSVPYNDHDPYNNPTGNLLLGTDLG